MTLIDALAALQEGAVPTNHQVLAFLSRLLSAFPPEKKLSKSGRGLVSDCKGALESLKKIVEHRNGNEELQEFLWKSRGTADRIGEEGLKIRWGKGATSKKERLGEEGRANGNKKSSVQEKASDVAKMIKNDGMQATRHLRTLARLMLVQPELRHILADVGYMFAEVVDKATGTSIEEARIQLGQVKSATGTFQNVATKALNTAKARKVAFAQSTESNGDVDGIRLDALKEVARGVTSGMPALSALRDQLSATFSEGNISLDAIRQELSNGRAIPALEELRRQAQTSAGNIATGRDDLERMRREIAEGKIPPEVMAALSGRDGIAPEIAESHNDEVQDVNGDALLAPTDLLDAAQMIAVANQKFKLAPASTIKNIAQATAENAKSNMKEAWTSERQERLVRRVKKLIIDCQGSQDYKEALEWFISRIETLAVSTQDRLNMPSTSIDDALSSTAAPLIQLLENFADGKSLRSILAVAKSLSVGVKEDTEIQSFWNDADRHLRRCLLEEGFILTKEAEEGMHNLIARFRRLESSYRANISKLIQESSAFAAALSNDELLKSLLTSIKNLTADLTCGKNGQGIPSRALLIDLWQYILPPLFDRFGVVPIPRIKYLHPDFDLVIENIAVELKHLLPDLFDMKLTNDVHLDLTKIKESTHSHSLKIKIKGMSIRIYKLAFALTTRMGFNFHDHGIADLLIANFGLSIYIDVPKDPGPHYFIVKKVNAKLGTLKLQIHKSNHRILHAMAGNLINSFMTRRLLRHFIGIGIKAGLQQLDVQLMTMKLNKDVEKGKTTVEDVKKQLAELRDLLKKYNEMAGTLEIDFTRGGESLDVGKSIEESHAVRWIQKQVKETGKKEIIRNEWRSNAFNLSDADSNSAWPSREKEEEKAMKVDSPNVESEEAAEIRQKPEGATDDSMIRKASEELKRAEEEVKPERNQLQNSQEMESGVGKEAVDKTDNRQSQIDKLEQAVESHHTRD